VTDPVAQALTLFIWFMAAVVLLFLLLIARMYWVVSSEKTYYWAFLIPIVLFGVAAVRQAFLGGAGETGDLLADGFSAVGGVLLIVLCMWLYYRMGSKQK
jgi:prolipoprotein diacylglyceryltransferase